MSENPIPPPPNEGFTVTAMADRPADFQAPVLVPSRKEAVLSPNRPDDFQAPATLDQLKPPEMNSRQKLEALSRNKLGRSERRGQETRKWIQDGAKRVSDKLFGPTINKLRQIKQGIGKGVDVALGLPGTVAELSGAGIEAGVDWYENKVDQVTDSTLRFQNKINESKNNFFQRVKNIKDRSIVNTKNLAKKGAILGLSPLVKGEDFLRSIAQIPAGYKEWRAERYEMKAMRKFHKREVTGMTLDHLLQKGDPMSEMVNAKLQKDIAKQAAEYQSNMDKRNEFLAEAAKRRAAAYRISGIRQFCYGLETSLPKPQVINAA